MGEKERGGGEAWNERKEKCACAERAREKATEREEARETSRSARAREIVMDRQRTRGKARQGERVCGVCTCA